MQTTPVRMRNEDKTRLERLRDDVTTATGERPSQQELLGKAVEFVLKHKDEFMTEVVWKPMSDREIKSWIRSARAGRGWEAVPVKEIDRVVYGDG